MDAVPRSVELSHEVEAVEQTLSDLRGRVEEESSAFAALEQQVSELRENLARTRSSISDHEARLAEKQAELAEAKRLEALENYKEDLEAHREAAVEVVRAATDLLAVVNAYDDETLRLRRLVEEMRDAFGSDERVAEVEAALGREPEDLVEAMAAVVGMIGWRVHGANGGDHEADAVSEELHQIAQERRRARIKEYFSRS
jgi:chromosome segregation ATPase